MCQPCILEPTDRLTDTVLAAFAPFAVNFCAGFYLSFMSVRTSLNTVLGELARSSAADYKVIVTGHSLGAALALLAGVDLACGSNPFSNPKVRLRPPPPPHHTHTHTHTHIPSAYHQKKERDQMRRPVMQLPLCSELIFVYVLVVGQLSIRLSFPFLCLVFCCLCETPSA
jgi:hypothetical protein